MFWDMAPCRLVNSCRNFERSLCLFRQGQAAQEGLLTLKMKEMPSFETSVDVNNSTLRSIPEDVNRQRVISITKQ